MKSPLKRIGGKAALAERIVAAFPHPALYDTYVEPCGGAGHVLMAKPAEHHEEIFNDLDDLLTDFWYEMQAHGKQLQRDLRQHLYSRRIYYDYYRSLFDGTRLSSFERALRWFYCLRATGTGWLRRSPVGWDHRGSNVRSFRSAIELFEGVQRRLEYVIIDNRDVLDTIDRYDSPRTLFYVDPPYIGAEHYYEPSKHGFPHEVLAERLHHVKGYVTLSYYPHDTLDALYPPERWRRLAWQQHKSSQIQLRQREEDIATEVLLLNYDPPCSASLWDEEVSA